VLPFVVFATRAAFQVPSCIGIRSSGDCRLFGPLQKKCIPSLDWLKSVQIGSTFDLFHPSFLASIGSYGGQFYVGHFFAAGTVVQHFAKQRNFKRLVKNLGIDQKSAGKGIQKELG
jgi:hypothetical protein